MNNKSLQIPSSTNSNIFTPLKSNAQGHTSSISKIEQIESYVSENRSTFICLRKLYQKYLKHYTPVRSIVIWAWKNLYPFYLNLKSIHLSNPISRKTENTKRWRKLTNLSEFSKKRGLVAYKIADAEVVNTPVPTAIPTADQSYLVSPHDQYSFPEISVAMVEGATIYGGSNLTLVDNEVICHDLFDAARDFTSEELHGRALINPKRKRIRWLSYDKKPVKLSTAATFVDACAPNYAHWLTEVLPRIALFCAEERHKDIPIVINSGLHENILNSLFEVIGSKRKVIALPIGRAIIVNKLFITSVAGYVPFERRTNKISGHSHGKFSPHAFNILTSHLSSHIDKTDSKGWPEKIFIRRNSGTRKVLNASEIENLLVTKGYKIVEPEKLTFSKQVQLFSHAKTIVGSSGAALANMLFLPRGAQIFILIGKYSGTSYWYWQNMACSSGKILQYCLGTLENEQTSGIHGNFHIPLSEISKAL